MKPVSEKTLDDKVVKAVERHGGKAVKLSSAWLTGFPDRTCLLPGGRVLFVELKTTGKTLSPRQRIVIPWLQKLGFTVYVVDDEITLDMFINDLGR